MTFPTLLLVTAVVVATYMLLFWLASLAARDASLVDIGWGLGFVVVAWVAYAAAHASGSQAKLLLLLTTLWGLRLSGYLAWRNLGKAEDRRYAAMRARHGASFWWKSLVTVFLLQGAVMWAVALPIVRALAYPAPEKPLASWQLLGVAVWGLGLLFESIGDWQLARFKANPENAGEVCRHGLWRYTRHPNYFGDFLVWWGLWLIALDGIGSLWTVVSPLLMSLLLMKYSGVGLLEQDIGQRRPKYAEYQRTTSAFFPWPPRSGRE